ncbi:hypothetical protein U1Q18_049198, partial [Sarracenia purpurea var. burkii]
IIMGLVDEREISGANDGQHLSPSLHFIRRYFLTTARRRIAAAAYEAIVIATMYSRQQIRKFNWFFSSSAR